mgnify:CR=1 FL=1
MQPELRFVEGAVGSTGWDGELSLHPGETIEISVDKGQNWQVAYDLNLVQWEPANPSDEGRQVIVRPGPLDAMFDAKSGNLLLAMGHAGVLLGLPTGEWRWVKVGRYASEAAQTDSGEINQDNGHVDIQPPAFVKVPPEIEIELIAENSYFW